MCFAGRQSIERGQLLVCAKDAVPGRAVNLPGDRKSVLPLMRTDRFGGLRAEDAVRHERLRVVVFLLDTPQTYLKIVDMAALLFVCVHFHSSSLST